MHQVRHLAGEAALLPCEVRTAECGAVYFITWSRNTSQEWHRIFVYSKASQKPFYDTYNQLIGRPNRYSNQTQKLSFDASNLTADGFAYLRVDSVDDDDEGMFRCDVTYVKGKCPSLTYTQLSTIGKSLLVITSFFVECLFGAFSVAQQALNSDWSLSLSLSLNSLVILKSNFKPKNVSAKSTISNRAPFRFIPVKPGKPKIQINGIELTNGQDSLQETFRLNGGSKHRRLAFEEGSTITLECSTSGEFSDDEIFLMQNLKSFCA